MEEKNTPRSENVNSPEKEGESNRHLDKSYVNSYRKWRLENKEKYGFFYRPPKNEYSYEEGRGFIKDIPEYAEVSTLSRVNGIICRILTVYLLFSAFASYFLPSLLSNHFGIYIGMNYNTKTFYGNELTIIIYEYITKIIGRLVPLILLAVVTKMPFSIMFPTKISNITLFRLSIPAALTVASAGSVMMYMYSVSLSVIHANPNTNLRITDNMTVQILSVILSVIINPILSELIVHGGFFQLLRQFGDGYSLVISGLILAMNIQDIRLFPFFWLIGISIGYFVLRTGSILTGIAMRITVHFYFYIQSFLASADDPNKSFTLSIQFMIICLGLGIAFLLNYMLKNNNKISLPLKDTYLTSYEKMMEFLTNPSVLIWLATGISIMIVSIPVDL